MWNILCGLYYSSDKLVTKYVQKTKLDGMIAASFNTKKLSVEELRRRVGNYLASAASPLFDVTTAMRYRFGEFSPVPFLSTTRDWFHFSGRCIRREMLTEVLVLTIPVS